MYKTFEGLPKKSNIFTNLIKYMNNLKQTYVDVPYRNDTESERLHISCN